MTQKAPNLKIVKESSNKDSSKVSALSPREIVSELDRYVIGQHQAKRAVAVALRNRWRRQALSDDMKDEVLPKNILMIGPTGVGKTEISRRLSKLAQAPFIKVEATRFTEVGYVGKDVEQIIRDLIEIAIAMEKEKRRKDRSRDVKTHLNFYPQRHQISISITHCIACIARSSQQNRENEKKNT